MPFSVKVFPAPKPANEAEQDEQWRKEKADVDKRLADETQRLADYTGLLAVITGSLFVAAILQIGLFWFQLRLIRDSARDTREMAVAARTTAETGRNEFLATHRPRIAVRNVAWTTSPAKKTANISFQYVNVGDNTGWVTELHYALVIIGAEPPSDVQLAEVKMGRMEITSGERRTHVFHSRDLFNMSEIATTRLPSAMDQTAYLIGRIIYIDIANRPREMGFCRVTQGTTHRWSVVKDSEHEYSD
jgi:hypothetical protein